MLDTRVAVPLLIFVAMVAASLWLVWRVVVAGGRARREKSVGHAAAEIARRCVEQLADLQVFVDDVRRRKLPSADARATLNQARAALDARSRDAGSLARGGRWAGQTRALADDIDRAVRAVDLVLYGTDLLGDGRLEDVGEGEVSIKRGYLNLVHAREAIQARREAIVTAAASR